MVLFPTKLNKTSQGLNSVLYVFMALGVIYVVRFFTKGLAIALFNPTYGYLSILFAVLTLLALVLVVTKVHKTAVYFFFFMHVVQCLASALLCPQAGAETLMKSIGGCIIFSLLLCLRKNGKSAWSAIFSQPYVERDLA